MKGNQEEGIWACGRLQRAEGPWQPHFVYLWPIMWKRNRSLPYLSRFILGSLVLATQPLSSYICSLVRLENVSFLSPQWANLFRSQKRNFVYLSMKQKQAKHKWDTWLHVIFGFWSLSIEWKAEEEAECPGIVIANAQKTTSCGELPRVVGEYGLWSQILHILSLPHSCTSHYFLIWKMGIAKHILCACSRN